MAAARTVAFGILAFTQLLYSFACHSRDATLRQLGILSNRPLLIDVAVLAALQVVVLLIPVARAPFKTVPLPLAGWLLIIVAALLPASFVEAAQVLRRRSRTHSA